MLLDASVLKRLVCACVTVLVPVYRTAVVSSGLSQSSSNTSTVGMEGTCASLREAELVCVVFWRRLRDCSSQDVVARVLESTLGLVFGSKLEQLRFSANWWGFLLE
jgi:hypothetical protein